MGCPQVDVMMQQNAARGLGVSPNSLPIPQEWGTKGVDDFSYQ
jgi:hypothetical protein